jgi:DNA-binding LacI/PurR family transcriptional regulator
VFIDRRARNIQADAVLSDNVGGAYLATRHLIERGHCRIGVVLGIQGATTSEERLLGYQKALNEAGIPYADELVVWGGYRMEGGRRATAALLSLSEPPTAIFSTNNLMTVGVLKELFYRGIKIPKEMAVVGFDDLEWAEMANPPLTAVAQRPYEIGRLAVTILLARLSGQASPQEFSEKRVPVNLVIRKST